MTLRIVDVAVSFERQPILKGVSLAVEAGSIVVLSGGNGSGKTTLLNVVSGLVVPSMGGVFLDSTPIVGMTPWRIARLGVTRVLQFPRLIQTATVLENVMFGASAPSESPLSYLFRPLRSQRSERDLHILAEDALSHVGLKERSGTAAATLSFGETKLVALSRALVHGGALVMFDEILSGLGSLERTRVIKLIRALAERGTAVVCVEHDMAGWEHTDVQSGRLVNGTLAGTEADHQPIG